MKRWLALLPCLVLAACADEGPPNPVVIDTPVPAEPVQAGEVVRRVETRNPLGGRLGNLLVDGDFELSVVIEGTNPQSGWVAFGNGLSYLRGATGGQCRSGLRCAWLAPGVLFFGKGAAAKSTGMIATVWARPPEGVGCTAMQAQVLRCNSFTAAANLFPEADEPGADGWCFYRGRVAQQATGTCMLLENKALNADPILVDDAAIVPDSGTTPLASDGAIPEAKFAPLRGERRERVQALVEWDRKRTKFGAPLTERPNIGLK